MTLQPGEDREFRNQFTEFLQKNIPADEQEKIAQSIQKSKKKKRTRKSKNNLDFFVS